MGDIEKVKWLLGEALGAYQKGRQQTVSTDKGLRRAKLFFDDGDEAITEAQALLENMEEGEACYDCTMENWLSKERKEIPTEDLVRDCETCKLWLPHGYGPIDQDQGGKDACHDCSIEGREAWVPKEPTEKPVEERVFQPAPSRIPHNRGQQLSQGLEPDEKHEWTCVQCGSVQQATNDICTSCGQQQGLVREPGKEVEELPTIGQLKTQFIESKSEIPNKGLCQRCGKGYYILGAFSGEYKCNYCGNELTKEPEKEVYQ